MSVGRAVDVGGAIVGFAPAALCVGVQAFERMLAGDGCQVVEFGVDEAEMVETDLATDFIERRGEIVWREEGRLQDFCRACDGWPMHPDSNLCLDARDVAAEAEVVCMLKRESYLCALAGGDFQLVM